MDTGLTRQEAFDTILERKDHDKSDKKSGDTGMKMAPIPKLSKLIISPPPPTVGGDKIISFSTTDQIPLKDVLIEFGRMVKIDVDIDPNIEGSIIINAKNRPLKEVIDRIATLGNLRYSYNNDVLRFESDTPYLKNYFVDYLTGGTVWTDVEANLTALLSGGNADGGKRDGGSSFTPNKSAGIISVFATEEQHGIIADYLANVEKYASAQVLIEAKVIEVNLSKSYSSGIKWDSADGDFSSSNGYTAGGSLDIVFRTMFTSDLTLSISALEKFGTTKTISSPRISAVNNQKAVLNFTDKLVYFQVQQTQSNTSATGGETAVVAETISSTKLEESVGIVLDITPSINLETREVTMNIKPTLSVLNSWVADPASPQDLADANGDRYVNQVPVIQSRELETTAKVQSGNILVVGGLMKDESSSADSGVPFVERIPVLGWLFKSMSRSSGVTETVIFIKATIINSGTPVDKVDRNIQKNFDPSKRTYFQ